MIRIGHGFDIHAFGGTKPFILGGIKIPYDKKLCAYSDGDVLIHSLIDALLGALALGDIGTMFPNDNPAYKNINSCNLLTKIYMLLQKKNYIVVNMDITIIAQKPKILQYINKIRMNIANIMYNDINNISIKSTTTEKLGFIGRTEGIASEAVVLLKKHE